jgi:medium-chain acyl-[acyl-carrier-protein] hydrolase
MPRSQPQVRLFCFPYAGGSAAFFRTWAEKLSSGVEVCPVQLPGRAGRLREPAFTRMDALVPELADGLARLLDRPFAFFGHSMGALVAFELARHLRSSRGIEPVHLFLSGRRAPRVSDSHTPIHTLDDRAFVAKLRQLEGTPDEVLANPDLMALLIPVLRADCELCETYSYRPQRPLTCPVTVFGGVEDRDVSRSSLERWREETAGPVEIRVFPGAHFFVRAHEHAVCQHIERGLGARNPATARSGHLDGGT